VLVRERMNKRTQEAVVNMDPKNIRIGMTFVGPNVVDDVGPTEVLGIHGSKALRILDMFVDTAEVRLEVELLIRTAVKGVVFIHVPEVRR